jgi:rhodanese-related sulfurtransferase
MQQVRAQQLADWLADESRPGPVLLDVREPWEVELCQLAGSQNIPMQQVPARCDELDPDQDIVVICHHGVRSMQVASFLEHKGFGAVHNLTGGVEAWANEVDSNMRRY